MWATGRRKKATSGFTLIELCVAGSILTLILSLCWPSLHDYSQSIVARTQMNGVVQNLSAARERAIFSGKTETIVLSSKGPSSLSAPSVSFFSDGSAEALEMEWKIGPSKKGVIRVEETGKILSLEI